jgi:protein-S-isoprenylcysteine O-methyltransferase Ste14
MVSALRHAIAVLVFPVTVVVVIPIWIARRTGTRLEMPGPPIEWATSLGGVAVLVLGGVLFVGCVWRFGTDGKGTLAPWDPPADLVVKGPYAYVRNPMITGVVLLLIAEGLLLRSMPHLQWAGLFFVINAVYIPLLEEPMLQARFGEGYERYRKEVPRLIPRARPWKDGSG